MYNRTVTKMMAVLILLTVSLTASAQSSNAILGKWKDAEHPEKQMEISTQNGKYLGKSVNSSIPAQNGKTILKDLIWGNDSKSYQGILINPDNGDDFKIEIKMIVTDRFRFSASKFIFSKTFTFNRIAQ